MDGRDALESDAEIEELKRAIRALLFVTKLSRVDAHKDKSAGWGATLKCPSCPDYCGKKQEPPVQLSRTAPGARHESTAIGARHVHWCAGVDMVVCHVVGSWICLAVCARS